MNDNNTFRPMRRFKQQMTETECLELLKTAPRGVLALLGDHDYPYAVPLDFVLDGDKIYFHCAKEGHKIDAIQRHDKASFCVLSEGRKNPTTGGITSKASSVSGASASSTTLPWPTPNCAFWARNTSPKATIWKTTC